MYLIRIFTILFISTVSLLIGFACHSENQIVSEESYESIKKRTKEKQDWYNAEYLTAGESKKDSLIGSAREYLMESITAHIFPHWYNTPWAFYGTTQIPGQGEIACGYFVTTVIRDAGFDIPRVKWAQLASETMIKKLNPGLKRFRNVPIDTIVNYFKHCPKGLYLVGLDMHVGFVYKNNKEVKFIHSSYYQPDIGVMQENLKGHNPLNDSKYRVFGQILHDEMIINWILRKKYQE